MDNLGSSINASVASKISEPTKNSKETELKDTSIIPSKFKVSVVEPKSMVETPEIETPVVETPMVKTPVVEPKSMVETPMVKTPVVETQSIKNTTRKKNRMNTIKETNSVNTSLESKPLIIETPEVKNEVFTLPLNSVDRYMDVWTMCKSIFSRFRQHGETLKGASLSVKEDTENEGKYALYKMDSVIVNGLSTNEVSQLMMLFRYRDLLEGIQPDISALEFFNEIEANREYHARACIVLCSLDSEKIKPEMVKEFNVLTLDSLDTIVYTGNLNNPFSTYEQLFLVNHMMVMMAEWENTWSNPVLKDQYLNAIVQSETSIPSHLRLLGRIVSEITAARKMYPQCLLMNYSMFYPFILHPSGKPPTLESN